MASRITKVEIFESDLGDYFTLIVTENGQVVFDLRMKRQELAVLRQNISDCLYDPMAEPERN